MNTLIEPATLDPIKYKRRKRPTSRIVMLGRSSVDIQTALKLGTDMSGSCVPSAKLKIEHLLRQHGPMPSADVVKHLEEQGVTRATWKRAQDELQKKDGWTMFAMAALRRGVWLSLNLTLNLNLSVILRRLRLLSLLKF